MGAFAMNMKQVPKDKAEYKNVHYNAKEGEDRNLSFKPNVLKQNDDSNRLATFAGDPIQSGNLNDQSASLKTNPLRFSNFYENIYSKEKSNILKEVPASDDNSVMTS
jgi:hypothetical protein